MSAKREYKGFQWARGRARERPTLLITHLRRASRAPRWSWRRAHRWWWSWRCWRWWPTAWSRCRFCRRTPRRCRAATTAPAAAEGARFRHPPLSLGEIGFCNGKIRGLSTVIIYSLKQKSFFVCAPKVIIPFIYSVSLQKFPTKLCCFSQAELLLGCSGVF